MIKLGLMGILERLKQARVEMRSFYLRKYRNDGEPFIWGVYIKVNDDTYQAVHQDLVEYFKSRSYDVENETAPSPSGMNPDGYKVYISSVCDNDDYSKNVGISVSIHHEDENLIPRDERANYCY